MARRKKGTPIHGWLILDKPLDITSATAVNKLKKAFDAKKCGHAGTLDPLATGILPIAFGEATKTIPYLVDSKKTYHFTVSWGSETTTDDQEGEITNTSDKRPSEQDIIAILPDFTGNIAQTPPKYSAIKQHGKRAYNLARENKDFELQPRPVFIEKIEVLSMNQNNTTFEVICGKGTYIRALARDMGRQLACFGHVSQLRRTRVGLFDETKAIELEKVLEKVQNLRHSAPDLKQVFDKDTSNEDTKQYKDMLLPVHSALDDIPAIDVTEQNARRLKHGQSVLLTGQNALIKQDLVYARAKSKIVAIGSIKKGQLHPTKVFNL